MILIDAHPRHDWLVKAVERRLREELAKLRVEINEEKSRMVDLAKGESFSFLGFEYRRIRSRNRVWRPNYAPKLKKRTALFAKLREVFRRNVSQPVRKVIERINPILRGRVNYFRIGDSSRCFFMVISPSDRPLPPPHSRSWNRSGRRLSLPAAAGRQTRAPDAGISVHRGGSALRNSPLTYSRVSAGKVRMGRVEDWRDVP